jgi:hypothetical protein
VRKQREGGNEVLLWLKVQWLSIYQWKANATSDRKLIDFLNLHIPVRAFRINRNSQRLERRLLDLSYEVGHKIKNISKNGSKKNREDFFAAFKYLSILKNEVISVAAWEQEIDCLKIQLNESKEPEVSEWKKKCEDIEKEKECLFLEMMSEAEQMKKYIKGLEREQFTSVKGTAIPKLKTKQAQNRKLKVLKTRAEKALYFSTLFGLELDSLKLKDSDDPQTFTVQFKSNSPTTPVIKHPPQGLSSNMQDIS